jgi:SAM-dependent methyltransferase
MLIDPRVRNINIDGKERMRVHRQVLSNRKMIKSVFYEFYRICLKMDANLFSGEGKKVEIGAGVGIFNEISPSVISTDIIEGENLDLVLDAQNMCFRDNSIRAIFGINCFHHLNNPGQFFNEIARVLVSGGGCVLIEPYYGIFSEFVHKNIHAEEYFDKRQKIWEYPGINKGAMSNANQALSYIVFKRDVEKFFASYPGLEIVTSCKVNNYLRYLCSGGIKFRQLLPDFMIPVLKGFETILIPFNSITALHHVIVIRKKRSLI